MALRSVLTVGDVARMCCVAPRTAVIWLDQGLIKSWRVPGSPDRRVHRIDLEHFMRQNGMEILLTYPELVYSKSKRGIRYDDDDDDE